MDRIKRQHNFHQSLNIKSRYAFEKKKMSRSYIEDFSNEVFYEIFDYLHGYDVYQAFQTLNIRFEDLLKNALFQMKIEFSSTTIFEYRYQQFLQSNKDHILSLQFSDEYILGQFITLSIINSSCYHLESIVLHRISTVTLLVLLFYLKSLPRLFSWTISIDDCDDNLMRIYQMIFCLPVLKYLKLGISVGEEVDITIPIATDELFSPIEYLVIQSCCTLDQVIDLISYTPRLSHLYCDNIVELGRIINSELLTKLINLVHLNVVINAIDFDEFELFLSSFSSQLKFLSIAIEGLDICYLDGDRWKRLISEKLTSLTEFHFSYADWI